MKASDERFTGWSKLAGYYCYLENGQIVRLMDRWHQPLSLWKPVDGGLNAIPKCSVSRFYQGLKRGTVVVR